MGGRGYPGDGAPSLGRLAHLQAGRHGGLLKTAGAGRPSLHTGDTRMHTQPDSPQQGPKRLPVGK